MILQCDYDPCSKLWSGALESLPEEWTEVHVQVGQHVPFGVSCGYCPDCGNETFETRLEKENNNDLPRPNTIYRPGASGAGPARPRRLAD